jgi:short-subunit dehydrogenase
MRFDLRGKTALVTGASAGIGREIARILARDVGTLVIVARRRERLDELAAELTSKRSGLRVIVRPVDLLDRPAVQTMLDELEQSGETIDVLVNNAGFGDYGFLHQREWSKLERMLELNVVSATFLLSRLVPSMVARGSGAVLNVGSIAGILPSPAMSAYSASKAYLNHLSEGMRAELAGTGVSVTVVCPGPIETEFQEVAGTDVRPPLPAAMHIEAAACAEQAVASLVKGQARVIPGIVPRLVTTLGDALPKALLRPVLANMGKKLRRQT